MKSTDELHTLLRAHARGLHHSTAAVELIIGHRCWLQLADFRQQLLSTGTDLDTAEVTVDLREALTELDSVNTALVARSVTEAAGH